MPDVLTDVSERTPRTHKCEHCESEFTSLLDVVRECLTCWLSGHRGSRKNCWKCRKREEQEKRDAALQT